MLKRIKRIPRIFKSYFLKEEERMLQELLERTRRSRARDDMMMVIGLDGATWKVIDPNLSSLPTFKRLKETWDCSTMMLRNHPSLPSLSWLHSAPLWTSIFSGVEPEEHKHLNFISKKGRLLSRRDIPVRFVWDILTSRGYSCVAINIPFVYPPYSFNNDFKSSTLSLALEEEEWRREVSELHEECLKVLKDKPDLFVVVFGVLDHVQHLHYGEPIVLEWYERIDSILNELVEFDDKIIICSDHGFDYWDRVKVRTTKPRKYKNILKKGDHDLDAILITRGIDCRIDRPEDIFTAILTRFSE